MPGLTSRVFGLLESSQFEAGFVQKISSTLIVFSLATLVPTCLLAQKPHAHVRVHPPVMPMTSPPLGDLEPIPAVWDLLEGMENPQRDGLTDHGLSDTIKSAFNPFDQIGNSKVHTVDGLNFEGVGVSARWPTPDANGAVGSTEYVQVLNAAFAVYDKSTGALLYGPAWGSLNLGRLWEACAGAPAKVTPSSNRTRRQRAGFSPSTHTTPGDRITNASPFPRLQMPRPI
jgi:hypothetical protein